MATSKFTVDQLETYLDAHAQAEFALDIDATMATVIENPFYELHPMGYRIEGAEAVAEMYRRMLPSYMANVRRADLRTKLFGDNSITCEYRFAIRQPDGGWLTAYRMGIVEFAEDGRVLSERDYISTAMADLMTNALGEDFIAVPGVSRI